MADLTAEEFKQMHDHLREHEKAISSLTIVMITASSTLLSAVGIFYFRLYSIHPGNLNVAFSYLFLVPTIIAIPLMSSIRGHRQSLYKMGLYIKVFLEGRSSGALWHRRLEFYQDHIKGESHDSVPFFTWMIACVSYAFFVSSLNEIHSVERYHYCAVLLLLIPILARQHYKHNELKNISKIESAWHEVKKQENASA